MTGARSRPTIGLVVLLIIAVGCCVVRFLVYRDPHTGLTFQWPDPRVLRFRVVPLVVGVPVGSHLEVRGWLAPGPPGRPAAAAGWGGPRLVVGQFGGWKIV